jgi:MAP/microtubule affinity-regulating kinase
MNVGTLPYMPPEALNGKLKLVSPCVDVWGVGVIIYSLIYGKLPFKGRTSDEKVSSILLCNYQHETNVSEDVKDLLNRIFVPKHN